MDFVINQRLILIVSVQRLIKIFFELNRLLDSTNLPNLFTYLDSQRPLQRASPRVQFYLVNLYFANF
jgi:hypothetical protein